MPPKKHTKFTDDGDLEVGTNGIDLPLPDYKVEKTYSKKRRIKNNNHSTGSGNSSGGGGQIAQYNQHVLPGPLNISRLQDLDTKKRQFTDKDLRFQTSTESSSPDDEEDPEEPKPNGKGKTVTFRDSEDSEQDSEESVKRLPTNPKKRGIIRETRLKDRQSLPVYQSRKDILKRVLSNQVTVLLGETGSGKSTQLPQLLYEHDSSEIIAITQPRRVAAISLATRVSEEVGSNLGDIVGYSVRFQYKGSKNTRIKYLTDGMLMRELMLNSNLKRYTTIILDEAHERTVLTDVLLGLIKRLLSRRTDLRIVIMSATLDAERFSKFFNNAEMLYVEGRTYPVSRYYLPKPIDDVVEAVIQSVAQLNLSEPPGDILVFLPGQEEIENCVEQLTMISSELPKDAPLLVPLALYASLSPEQQQRAFERLPPRRRKVILATNVAETSLTIPGIKYVVDSGLRKIRVWKSDLGMDTLLTTAISKASAAQRMGRAGREAPGKCFRLFTEQTYDQDLIQQTEAEILRCDITQTILMLKKAGIDDVLSFDWIESPGKKAIISALIKLYGLKALDDSGKITTLGREMVVLPVSPQLAAVLLTAKHQHSSALLSAVIDIVACLSIEDLLINPSPKIRDEVNQKRHSLFGRSRTFGDLIMLREMYHQYKTLHHHHDDKVQQREWCKSISVNYKSIRNVDQIRNQLRKYLEFEYDDDDDLVEQQKQDQVEPQDIIKCFLNGYIHNTAIALADRRFKTVINNQTLNIHPSSMIFGQKVECIMYMEYVFTVKGYARTVSPIQIEWLQTVAPHLLSRKNVSD